MKRVEMFVILLPVALEVDARDFSMIAYRAHVRSPWDLSVYLRDVRAFYRSE